MSYDKIHYIDTGALYTPDGNIKILNIWDGDVKMLLVKNKETNECGYFNPVTEEVKILNGVLYGE